MLDKLTPADFQPHVGTTFRATNVEPAPVELVLSEVVVHPAQPNSPRAEPFSLLFAGSAETMLPQHIYVLEHEAMGTLTIFLVPLSPTSYEAAFN
ncbi:MAG TPA: hypothetical protein VFA94_07410 [Acidimicrobiales bacterium]|nr:hypothetical protein [Acidimicrobiales bacterium]